ncbi:MAG: AHH domain-containing protein, partial [Rhodocyclaceae bacterium]|nr:AHH domain-containing protein [Rhodocyclaceae bacterium]
TAVWEYAYHPQRGWLTEVKKDTVVVASYGYDDNGNRTSWSDFWGSGIATYDDQDRQLTAGPVDFTYTANGELLTKTAGPDVTGYLYDVRGALLAVDLPNGIEIDYLVDASGRRIGKKINGVLTKGWIYAGGLSPLAETDGSGAVTQTYVYATKGSVPDYLTAGGETYRIFTDHLGSVRLVVNVATGAIEQRIDYDAWGRITLDTNPGFQPFGFAGGLYDYQTGLVRFGARDYDPETGRWTAKDPIGFGGGSAGLFEYCGNRPVSCVDRSGLQDEDFEPDFRPHLPVEPVDGLEAIQTIGEVAWAFLDILHDVWRIATEPAPGLTDGPLCLPAPDGSGLLCGEFMVGALSGPRAGGSGGPWHHGMTNKNWVSTLRGGPWSPRFAAMAKKAGMTLDDLANKVRVPGHFGPHPEAYHQAVFDRLTAATQGLSGDAYGTAFRTELAAVLTESATEGSVLNLLLTTR